MSLETTFAELRDVARIFGVTPRAEKLIDAYRAELQAVRDRIGAVSRPPTVFWYDAGDPPQVGACCGAPNEILRLVGATNIFADTPGSWTPVSWEAVIARNPDVIVLANASWSTAAAKRQLLFSKKALAGVEAIKQQADRRDRLRLHDARDQERRCGPQARRGSLSRTVPMTAAARTSAAGSAAEDAGC